MGTARHARQQLLRTAAALAVLPALLSVTDAARADDASPAPTTAPTSTAAPTASPTGTPTAPPVTPTPVTLTPSTPTPSTPPPSTPPPSTPTLRLGAKGPDVLRLQRRLRALGYDVGKVNSRFGDDTLHAVRAFQKVQGTAVNGVVTKATWSRLASPRIPTARFTRSRAAVEVDLTRRVLYLTRGGSVTAIFDVSPGKPSTPTVTGTYRIYRRVNRWDHGPLGGLYKPNYFHRGFALHGSLSVPTYAASHGCVRLTTASMDRLWSQLSTKETVSLYRS